MGEPQTHGACVGAARFHDVGPVSWFGDDETNDHQAFEGSFRISGDEVLSVLVPRDNDAIMDRL